MEKNRLWMWIGFLVIVLAVLLLLFWPRERPLNWDETYDTGSDDPYGAKVIYELLKEQTGKERFLLLEDSLIGALDAGSPANYLFLGSDMWQDEDEWEYLLEFVRKGNTALLITRQLPYGMLSDLLVYYCPDPDTSGFVSFAAEEDSAAVLSLTHQPWQDDHRELRFYFRGAGREYDWAFFDPALLCEPYDVPVYPLGHIEGLGVNYLRIPLGEGTLLLHTTPLAFSNFYLLEESGLSYAEHVLAYLNDGPVYWDRYSDHLSAFQRGLAGRSQRTTRTLSEEGPLQYILGQPPLAWAWYTALATALLYLLFRAKRRQRIIPVMEPNTNTSMEFIATIGQLYFQQHNHRKLALLKWKLFLGFIRERYHMPTRDLDDAFIRKLAERSGFEPTALNPLFRLAGNIERSQVFLSENTLIDLHKALDHFYRNCK